MTRLIIESDNVWTGRRIRHALHVEQQLLKRLILRTQKKLDTFERAYGVLDRERLYGQVDDMELLEWEGEIETLEKLRTHLQSLEEMTCEYQ